MADPALAKQKTIREVYNPEGEELDNLRFVYKRKQQMGDKRREHEKDWDKWEKQWNAYRPPKDADDWKSDIYIPLTTSIIEAQLSEVIEQELRPWAVARGSEDSAKAEVINAIMDYTWDVAKSDVALFNIIKDAFIFGTGIGMEYYWRQPRTIKGTDGKTEHKVLEYDDCYLEPVRLWDFYIDETARDFSGPYAARDCIRRYIMDIDDFNTFFTGDVWNKMDNAKFVKPGGDANYYEFYKPPDKIEHDRQVEVLWYWNKPQDLLCIVANDVVVTMKPNPHRHKQLPFVRALDVRKPYQFYGKGECELLASLQDEINTLRRMTIDRSHLDIDKPILVSDTLTIEDEDIIARPHGVIPVGDINSAKPFEYSDIPMSTFKQLEMLNDDKIRVTGMDERMQGVNTGGTATEAAILKEATIKRLNMKMWQVKNDTLIDVGRIRVENIMQFYSQPKLEAIIGKDAVAKATADGSLIKKGGKNFKESYRNVRLNNQAMSVNPQTQQPQIAQAKGTTFFEARPEFFLPTHGGYDIKYKATSTIPLSKPLQQQKADEMYDRLAMNQSVDQWKLAEYLLKSRDLNPDEFQKQAQPAQAQPAVNLQKIVDLAGVENAQMMEGKPINPTPYAPVVHTEVHITFMQSDKFKKDANDKVVQIFTRHVLGEIAAQKQRGEATPGQDGADPNAPAPGGAPAPAAGTQASSADLNGGPSAVNPAQVEGGANTPNVSGSQSQ